MMKPWHIQALARLDPDDPDVAKVYVIAYAKHLKEGGTSANFIYEGIAMGPMAFRALETYIKNAEVIIPDEELQPGIAKILEIADDPTPVDPLPSDDHRQVTVQELPSGPGRPALAWIVTDGTGPLGAYASEEEANEAVTHLQEVVDNIQRRPAPVDPVEEVPADG